MNLRLSFCCAIFIALTSCSMERAQTAALAKTRMVGFSKEKVLSCMGVPAGKQKESQTELWSYNSGGEAVSTFSNSTNASMAASGNYASGNAVGFGTGMTSFRYCVVNITFTDGLVTAVNYQGKTGGLITEGEQCAYAVANCLESGDKAKRQ